MVTVETYKSLQGKSLRFAIFWKIFENWKFFKILRVFWKTNSVTIYTFRLYYVLSVLIKFYKI